MKLTIAVFFTLLFFIFRRRLKHFYSNNRDTAPGIIMGTAVVMFVLVMAIHPGVIFQGAVAGIDAWWNIVFPSLLPFFIAAELMLSLGIVHFLGVLMEPVMRPVFNVPGSGSFVVAIGFTSGFPIGAMTSARLRSEGLCTRIEAERLVSFTNNSNPLFMLVAVAVGMFNNPGLGYIIAGAHYAGNLTLGLLLRFYGRNDREKIPGPALPRQDIPGKALQEMTSILRKEQRPPGKIISDAVRNSINNLFNIGGFIILFAVIIRLLTELGFISCLAGLFYQVLGPLGVAPGILEAIFSGVFEMTTGSRLASETQAPLLQQLVAVAVILAWSGLSILAQAASMISHTDIRFGPFLVARVFHAVLAAIYTVILFKLLHPAVNAISSPATGASLNWLTCLNYAKTGLMVFFGVVAILIILSLLAYFIQGIARSFSR